MRLWRRRAREEAARVDEPRPGMDAALAAVHRSREAANDARSRAPQVAEVVARLRSLKEENHISARFDEAVREGLRGGSRAGSD